MQGTHSTPDPMPSYYDGMAHLESNRPQEALECFRNSWAMHEHAATAYRIAQSLGRLDRHTEAQSWFARAHKLNPQHSMYATDYAASLHRSGRSSEAEAILRDTLNHNRTYGPAQRLLASLAPPPGSDPAPPLNP